MSIKELKKYLKEDGRYNKAELEKLFRDKYNIPKNVLDPVIYYQARERVKRRVKTWPSAYASGQVVNAYKRDGGRYRGSKKNTDLDRWYQEHWVNICEKNGEHSKYLECSSDESKRYPYCRPSVRVNSQTPKTVGELSKTKIKEMCSVKKSKKKVYL